MPTHCKFLTILGKICVSLLEAGRKVGLMSHQDVLMATRRPVVLCQTWIHLPQHAHSPFKASSALSPMVQ